jgi:putative membrane protein
MLRILARLVLNVLSNAIGLFMASVLLDGFSIDGLSFIVAVAIFSIVTTILGPLITKIALQSASYLMGGIALVTTFVGLVITTLLTDGINIDGTSTWFVATLVIWVFSLIGSLLLPLILFKKVLEDKNQNK